MSVTMRTLRPAFALLLLTLAATGCRETTITAVDAAEIQIAPPDRDLSPGESLTLEVVVTDAAGNRLEGRSLSWSSEDETIAGVDGHGVVEGKNPGTTTIRAHAGRAEGSVPVTVGEPPRIEPAPDGVDLDATSGSEGTATREIGITNGGGGTLTGLEVDVEHVDGPGGWLAADLDRSEAPATVTLRASAGELDAGTYAADLVVRAASAANAPRSVRVTLRVSPPAPSIRVSTSRVEFEADAGGSGPSPRSVQITNGGGGSLEGLSTSTRYDGPGGWLGTSLNRTTAPATLTLGVSPDGLEPGRHEAVVGIEADGTEGPVEVEVTLELEGPPAVTVPEIRYRTTGSGGRHLLITTIVEDEEGGPVRGAEVTISIRNVDRSRLWVGSGTTGGGGALTLRLSNHPSGCYVTTVTELEVSGAVWDGHSPSNEYCR